MGGARELREALERAPLDDVAAARGVAPEALRAMLVEAGRDVAAQDAPWWPEARRLLATSSLRAVARAFDTEPRRIRRALARLGLRVAGEALDGRGVAVLARAPLGRVADDRLARDAGVIPEAVAGERRRRGIAPYRPGRRARPRPGSGPIEVVVRRPAASETAAVVAAPPAVASGAIEPRAAFSARTDVPEASREARVRRFLHARPAEEPSELPGAEARLGRQRLVRVAPMPVAPPSAPAASVAPTPASRRRPRADRWHAVEDPLARAQAQQAIDVDAPEPAALRGAPVEAAPPPPPTPSPVRTAPVMATPVSSVRWRAEFSDAPPWEFDAQSLAVAVELLARRVGPASETARLSRLAG
jgi:hypothetical protein